MKYSYRPIDGSELQKVQMLLRENSVWYDEDIVTRFTGKLISPRSVKFGCFIKDKLIGMYTLHRYKMCIAGSEQNAATMAFIVVDKIYQGRGIGTSLDFEIMQYMGDQYPDVVVCFVEKRLSKITLKNHNNSWLYALSKSKEGTGFKRFQFKTVRPVFRPRSSKLPEISRNEIKSYCAEYIRADCENASFIEFSKKFKKRFNIAEISHDRVIKQLQQYPDKHYLFKISFEGVHIGFISCYEFIYYKDNKIQKQFHFDELLVDEMYLPGSINSVITQLELNINPDMYIVNNASILSNIFMYKAGFYPGLKILETYLWCKTKAIFPALERLNDEIPFSLCVI